MSPRPLRKLSLSTLGAPGCSVAQLIELAQRFALDGIELALSGFVGLFRARFAT